MRINSIWVLRKVGDSYIPIPENTLYCSICGGRLLLHDFACYYHRSTDLRHCDVHLKCEKCGHYVTFGLSVSQETYNLLSNSKYHRRTLRNELKEIYSLNEDTIIRLKSWGYW